jgi:succinate dehydrogenase flavin-adding protein (antitoxin of CptAB toxin-antitoxin module)
MALEDIGFDYQENRKRPFVCKSCGKTYKMLGRHLDSHFESHQDGESKPPEPMQKPTIIPRSNKGRPLTQEEFEEIKEMLFRGETMTDIVGKVRRGVGTVKVVQKSETLDEYFEISRSYWKDVEKKQAQKALPVVHAREPIHYRRLREMREGMDKVLVEFIAEEMSALNQDLAKEMAKLRSENKQLRERIEQLEQPDFVKTLKTKLESTVKSE